MNHEDMQLFSFKHNLSLISKWHNLTQASYKNFLEVNDKESEEDKKYFETVINGYMTRKMRNFCFIMHLSNFEEISFHVCSTEGKTPATKSSLTRFKEGWSSRLNKDVDRFKEWHTLLGAEKVRNCILHACERLSLVKEKNRIGLEKVIQIEDIEVELDRLVISTKYINKVTAAIIKLIEYKKENP